MTMKMCLAAMTLVGMLSAQGPEFEVASIKRNIDGGPMVFMGMKSPGTYSAQNETVRNLIQGAYGAPSGQRNWLPFIVAPGLGVPIVGGPEWTGSERYDITAKWNVGSGDGRVTIQSIGKAQAEMAPMLRSLLERRFQLKVHRETRELPVYEMTLAKAGKLARGSCTTFDPEHLPDSVVPGQLSGSHTTNYCGASRLGRKGLDWTLDGTGMRMGELADTLSFLIGSRVIIDKTGFTEGFDIHLRWTPGRGEVGADVPLPAGDSSASVFTVLREQLGLELKTGTGPVEVLAIDHVERPSAN